MRSIVLAGLLSLPAVAIGQTTTSTAARKMPPGCTSSLGVCELELYRRGAIQQAKREAAESALAECRDRPAAAPMMPSTVTIEYKTPTWVPWAIGLSVTAAVVLGIVAAVQFSDATSGLGRL